MAKIFVGSHPDGYLAEESLSSWAIQWEMRESLTTQNLSWDLGVYVSLMKHPTSMRCFHFNSLMFISPLENKTSLPAMDSWIISSTLSQKIQFTCFGPCTYMTDLDAPSSWRHTNPVLAAVAIQGSERVDRRSLSCLSFCVSVILPFK